MRTPLDTELLRTLVTIVETESFTASGEKLRRTQPAVSMQMKRLEDAVGKRLFEQRYAFASRSTLDKARNLRFGSPV
ncbi:hypothetical protein DK26_01260 [Bosea sp. WAO]|nr:hypothetical protein DK26_01260 [Bosea sp. WAO]